MVKDDWCVGRFVKDLFIAAEDSVQYVHSHPWQVPPY